MESFNNFQGKGILPEYDNAEDLNEEDRCRLEISKDDEEKRTNLINDLKKSEDSYLQKLGEKFEAQKKTSRSIQKEIDSYEEVKKYIKANKGNELIMQLIEASLNSVSLPSNIKSSIEQRGYEKIVQVCDSDDLTEEEKKSVHEMAFFYLSNGACALDVLGNCEEYKDIIKKLKENPDDKGLQLMKVYADSYQLLFKKNDLMMFYIDNIELIGKLDLENTSMDAIIKFVKDNPGISQYEIYNEAVKLYNKKQEMAANKLESQL